MPDSIHGKSSSEISILYGPFRMFLVSWWKSWICLRSKVFFITNNRAYEIPSISSCSVFFRSIQYIYSLVTAGIPVQFLSSVLVLVCDKVAVAHPRLVVSSGFSSFLHHVTTHHPNFHPFVYFTFQNKLDSSLYHETTDVKSINDGTQILQPSFQVSKKMKIADLLDYQ